MPLTTMVRFQSLWSRLPRSNGTVESIDSLRRGSLTDLHSFTPPPLTQERLDKEITKAEFELSFAYPIDQACIMLNVGPTALKTYCRSIGIKRWPYRKVVRCQQLAKKLNSGMGSRTDHKTLLDQMSQLSTAPTSLLWRHLGVDMIAAMNTFADDGTSTPTMNTSAHTAVELARLRASPLAASPGSVTLTSDPSLPHAISPPQQHTAENTAKLMSALTGALQASMQPLAAPPPSATDLLVAALQHAAQGPCPAPAVVPTGPTNAMVLDALLRYCNQLGAC